MKVEPDDQTRTVDVLEYRDGEDDTYRLVQAGMGEQVVLAHERERRKQAVLRVGFAVVVGIAAVGYGWLTDSLLLGAGAAVAVVALFAVGRQRRDPDQLVPTVVERGMFPRNAAQRYDIGEGASERQE